MITPRAAGRAPLAELFGKGENCLFCAPKVLEVTPRSPLLGESGRLASGEAFLFPNLFPFGLESAVCVYTTKHDLDLLNYAETRVIDAVRVCRDFCRIAVRSHAEPLCTAIYGNYMPPSGSSVEHPHLQVLADPEPLNLARRTALGVERYHGRTGRSYFEELVKAEEDGGRMIARLRHFDWFAPFAPMGVMHLQAVGREPLALEEMQDHLIDDLVDGLLRAFRYYLTQDIDSFNLILFGSATADPVERRFPLQMHAVVRQRLLPHYRSDATALEHLYGEPGIDVSPEVVARQARDAFADI